MTRAQVMNKFCKRRPLAFHGKPDLILAEAWLKETKVIFRTLDITRDGDRVALATYQLKGEARNWWELMETTHDVAIMTFDEFENIFLDKYFPTPLKQAKAHEFMNLEQGTLTVTQYAARFEELSCYAQNIIPTEDDKARKFEWGLSTSRKAIVGHAFPTYSEVVKCALRLERADMDYKKKAETSIGGPIRTGQNSNTNSDNRGPYLMKPFNSQANNQPWRSVGTTQGQTQGPPQGTGRDITTMQCHNCQEWGHYKNKCPHPQKEKSTEAGNQLPKRSIEYGGIKEG
ncbi:uncharacterized protein LOC131303052 [Rhododendron vialii]|uniref:uncharacterized protein LOC131303052 n=1 Tax=Rhododendron vialii TaxID=182163 RepID=UPI00265DAFAD|nr:uncharacterized protein LOC131303052 [Rhododendron vialii]